MRANNDAKACAGERKAAGAGTMKNNGKNNGKNNAQNNGKAEIRSWRRDAVAVALIRIKTPAG
jgi:hypothetical protein